MRVISYGGGVQSTALIVLATQGRIGQVDAAVFANVGDDSEHPATLDYVRNVMTPWAAERDLPVHEVQRIKRDGAVETLWGRLVRPGSRSLPIPVRMPDTGAPGTRSCTKDFKIDVLRRWARNHGATKENPVTKLIGISTDEYQRAGNKREDAFERVEYPLLDLGLDRSACAQIIRDAGLRVPPKSSCFFCPFHRPQVWAEMRRDEPELFDLSADLEDLLNLRRAMLGKDSVYLTRFGRPLREAIARSTDPPVWRRLARRVRRVRLGSVLHMIALDAPSPVETWAAVVLGPGVRTLFTIDSHGNRVSLLCHSESDALDKAFRHPGRDVWVGMARLRDDFTVANNRRGTFADVESIHALWLDLDIAGPGHKTQHRLAADVRSTCPSQTSMTSSPAPADRAPARGATPRPTPTRTPSSWSSGRSTATTSTSARPVTRSTTRPRPTPIGPRKARNRKDPDHDHLPDHPRPLPHHLP